MVQGRSSAAIQYSRIGPVAETAATGTADAWAESASAAATLGGTSTSLESALTSTSPLSVATYCPAKVQTNAPPVRLRKPRRSIGAGLTTALLFLDGDRHLHLRRVDRADEFVGAGGIERLLELGVRHRRRLGRIGALLLQSLGPGL